MIRKPNSFEFLSGILIKIGITNPLESISGILLPFRNTNPFRKPIPYQDYQFARIFNWNTNPQQECQSIYLSSLREHYFPSNHLYRNTHRSSKRGSKRKLHFPEAGITIRSNTYREHKSFVIPILKRNTNSPRKYEFI